MERQQLAWIIAALTGRIRDFPDAALNELFGALGEIERKYDLLEPLSEADKRAIDEGLADIKAGRFITQEQFEEKYAHILKDYDRDAAGKESFADAVSRVGRLPGEEQNDIASVLFALLNEYRYDLPPEA
jgi:hypothetical protein